MQTELNETLKDFFGSFLDGERKLPPSYVVIPLTEPAREERLQHTADRVFVPFKGSEIYLLHKSFIDSGGAPGETYKSLFEKTGANLANKNQKGFRTESLQKCSDKVDYEAKENVKRFLQKMIRNIDSY